MTLAASGPASDEAERVIYLDNAATSWPKAPGVGEAMLAAIELGHGNPGRGSHHLAVEAGRTVLHCREQLAQLFNLDDPFRLVFTANVTEALNLALFGWLRAGDRVVTTAMEHNAVMRPLHALGEQRGITIEVVPAAADGTTNPADFGRALEPGAALAVVNHASNVSGTIAPLAEIAVACRERGVPLLVDAAQTAGSLPLDMKALGIDMLAFTGHKSLLGPTGTGGLCLAESVDTERLLPLVHGGTGSQSELELQPSFLPDRYEAGTLNAVGIAGLLAAVSYVRQTTVERIRAHELSLTRALAHGLRSLRGVSVYGPADTERQVSVVSFTIEGMQASEVAVRLEDEFGILVRSGLHCAPSAHRSLGTYPRGTVRFGLGYFNTEAQVERALEAVAVLAHSAAGA